MNTHTNNGGPSGPAPLREKVGFVTNVPTLVQLEFDPPAQARAGRFGDQYMYFLAGNRIMFVDPEVHEEILRAQARAGSQLAICKRELHNAGRKHIRWEVEKVQEEPAEAAAPAPKAKPATGVLAPASGNMMAAALRQAIEAVQQSGFENASHEDIRALAITIYIQATGGGKR